MKKVLIVCGNGLGSSFIVEMNVKKILAEMNKDIAEHLSSHSAKVVGLSNLLDNNKIKEILAENI